MNLRRATPLLCLLLAAAALGGCREDPAEVINRARDALQSGDTETFLAQLDPASRAFIARSQQVAKVSAGTFEVLGRKGVAPDLLPSGDILEGPEGQGHCDVLDNHLCLVKIKKRRTIHVVPMRLHRGQWRVALLEMDRFLEKVQPR